MATPILKTIVLICSHTNPADHFSVFSESLTKEGYKVQICASELVAKKFQEKNIDVEMIFTPDNLSEEEELLLAEKLNKTCSHAFAVISDVGHKISISLHKTLAEKNPQILRVAYYDNPESPDPFLPLDYSTTAKYVMRAAQVVLFANSNLATDPTLLLPTQKRIGLGYYPISQADKIAKRRELEHASMRSTFLQEYGKEDKGQKILTYFGGNNQEYFQEAFPAFLQFLSTCLEKQNLSHLTFVLQQHPGAKKENLDRKQVEAWIKKEESNPNAPSFIISTKTTDEMQVITEGALYHQTSMGPLLAIPGIPLMQVGAKPYEDILIKGGLCPSITDAETFLQALSNLQPQTISSESRHKIFNSLGIKENWPEELKKAFLRE